MIGAALLVLAIVGVGAFAAIGSPAPSTLATDCEFCEGAPASTTMRCGGCGELHRACPDCKALEIVHTPRHLS